MNIVSLGDWTEDFTGAPQVSSRLTLGAPQNLQEIKNLRLLIETTGAHGNIFCRLENDVNNYVEFNMGGDRTGAGELDVLNQTLIQDLKAATFVQATIDFDPNTINSIFIYFIDDSGVTGTASVDKTTIALSNDSLVVNTIDFVEGFKTSLQSTLGPSSTTVQTADRPYDPNTGLPIDETLLVFSDNVSRSFKDFSGDVVGVLFGEVVWVTFNSINTLTGVVTWDIVHAGITDADLPPNLGSVRNSFRMTHAPLARCVIALMKGLIQEGIDQVNARASEIEESLVGSVAPPSRLGNGLINAQRGVSIDASLKLVEGNANFRGISRDSGTDVQITYDTYGQVSSGHTGLDPELPIFIETDGSIVQVATGTTIEVGFPLNATQIQLFNIANFEIASQPEAEAGVENTKHMTPLRTKQAVDSQVPTIVNTIIESGGSVVYPTTESLLKKDATYLEELPTFAKATSIQAFGRVTTNRVKSAFKVIGNGVSMTTMKLALNKTGTPTDNLVVRIETDSSGEPSGTLVDANATSDISGPGLTTSFVDTLVTFAGAFIPADNTPYWVVLERDGTDDNADYFNVGYDSNLKSFYSFFKNDGVSWTEETERKPYFSAAAGFHTFVVTKTDADNIEQTDLLGFVSDATVAQYSDATINIEKVVGIFAGLTTNIFYYLSATPGEITTINTGFRVGLTLSDVVVCRDSAPKHRDTIYGVVNDTTSSVSPDMSASTNVDIEDVLGYRVKMIQLDDFTTNFGTDALTNKFLIVTPTSCIRLDTGERIPHGSNLESFTGSGSALDFRIRVASVSENGITFNIDRDAGAGLTSTVLDYSVIG